MKIFTSEWRKVFFCRHNMVFTGETNPRMRKNPSNFGIADLKEFYKCSKCSKETVKPMTIVCSHNKSVNVSTFDPYDPNEKAAGVIEKIITIIAMVALVGLMVSYPYLT